MSGRMVLVGGVLLVLVLGAGYFAFSGLMSSGGAGGQSPEGPPGADLVARAKEQYEIDASARARQQRIVERQNAMREEEDNAPAVPEGPRALTQSTYDALKPGMPFEKVIDLVGAPEMRISRTGAKFEMYRWSNASGDSYMAKFEDGKLLRKTRLNVEEEGTGGPGKRITMKQYNQIKAGMSEGQVSRIVGVKPEVLNTNNTTIFYYRWTDATGTSFSAKFTRDKLESMTGLIGPASPDEPPPPQREQRSSVETLDNPPQEQPLRGSLSQEEIESFVAARRAPTTAGDPAPEADEDQAAPSRQIERISSIAPDQRRPQVAVVGGSRKEEEGPYADSSYKPRAKLPAYSHSLRRGVYEIKVVNESEDTVNAGLRAGKRGDDIKVPAGGSASFQVDRGTYTLHYLYKDDPYTLYSGDPISIDGQNMADLEVRIQGDAYVVDTMHEIFTPNRTPLEAGRR